MYATTIHVIDGAIESLGICDKRGRQDFDKVVKFGHEVHAVLTSPAAIKRYKIAREVAGRITEILVLIVLALVAELDRWIESHEVQPVVEPAEVPAEPEVKPIVKSIEVTISPEVAEICSKVKELVQPVLDRAVAAKELQSVADLQSDDQPQSFGDDQPVVKAKKPAAKRRTGSKSVTIKA